MTTPSTVDCALCIDGFMPAGTRLILGPVYRLCPACIPACSLCASAADFPINFRCLPCLCDYLAALGLTPVLCVHCTGVVDLIRTDTLPEVTGHDHP
jgi:hypothetical protein